MTVLANVPFSGNLFALRWADNLAFDKERVDVDERPTSVSGWFTIVLSTREPVIQDGPHQLDGEKYKYTFILRRSGPHFLLVAQKSELVSHLLNVSNVRGFSPKVDVQRLVRDLASTPEAYLMSAVYARVDAFGASLRSISFFGSDLADARLFREILSSCAPYRVNLRDIRSAEDVLTIGSRGEISFHNRGEASFSEIDKALAFLRAGNYMQWDGTQ